MPVEAAQVPSPAVVEAQERVDMAKVKVFLVLPYAQTDLPIFLCV